MTLKITMLVKKNIIYLSLFEQYSLIRCSQSFHKLSLYIIHQTVFFFFLVNLLAFPYNEQLSLFCYFIPCAKGTLYILEG